MDYHEACEATVSRADARHEIWIHSNEDPDEFVVNWRDFVAEHGEHATYSGNDVMAFLGY